VEAYAQEPVTFIAIERSGPTTTVQNWIDVFGWTFPVGINSSHNEIFLKYEGTNLGYDTFYVIDPEGRLVYRDPKPNSTSDFPRLAEAIDAALTLTPVRPLTWGRIKSLYP
jgi:hypothetical protein